MQQQVVRAARGLPQFFQKLDRKSSREQTDTELCILRAINSLPSTALIYSCSNNITTFTVQCHVLHYHHRNGKHADGHNFPIVLQ